MVSNSNEFNLLESMGVELRAVVRLHYRAQRQHAACCGITTMACHILTELGQIGPMPMVELGRRLGLHKGWVSRAVASLVEEGFVSCTRHESDGRMILVGLTPKGKRKLQALNQSLNQQAAQMLSDIPKTMRKGALRSLQLIRAALEGK